MRNLQRLPVLIRDEAGLDQDAVEQAEDDRENGDADAKQFCRNHIEHISIISMCA